MQTCYVCTTVICYTYANITLLHDFINMFYGPVVHDEFMVRARPEAEQQQKRCTLGIAVCLALSCFRHVFIVCFVVRLFVLSYFFHRLICPPLLFCFVFGCLFFVVYCVSCYFLRCYFVSCSLSIACFVVRLFVLSHSSAVWKASRKQFFHQAKLWTPR